MWLKVKNASTGGMRFARLRLSGRNGPSALMAKKEVCNLIVCSAGGLSFGPCCFDAVDWLAAHSALQKQLRLRSLCSWHCRTENSARSMWLKVKNASTGRMRFARLRLSGHNGPRGLMAKKEVCDLIVCSAGGLCFGPCCFESVDWLPSGVGCHSRMDL